MVRQFLEGQRFFNHEFGIHCKEVWIYYLTNVIAYYICCHFTITYVYYNYLFWFSLVLASGHVWLLCSAASDNAALWHFQFLDTEAQLELG